MPVRFGIVFALTLCACGSGSDSAPCRSTSGDPYLGGIPSGTECLLCDTTSQCQSVYGDALEPGCTAICANGTCVRYCDGEGCFPMPDGGGCVPGDQSCTSVFGFRICDPACGSAGGCRGCGTDEQCQRELGPTGRCQTHCGTCCRPEDNWGDGGAYCGCI